MNRPALLAKIRDAARRYGAKTEIARALGYTRATIREKLKRDDGFTDDELRRAAAALIGAAAEEYLEGRTAGEAGGGAPGAAAPGPAEQPAAYSTPFNEQELFVVAADVLELIEEEELGYSAEERARLIIEIYKEKMARAKNGAPELRAAEIVRLVRRRA